MTATAVALSKPIILRAWHLVAVLALVLAAAGAMFSKGDKKVGVAVVTVGYQDINAAISATGTVVPKNDYPARATFTGLVDKIYVHLGPKGEYRRSARPHERSICGSPPRECSSLTAGNRSEQ